MKQVAFIAVRRSIGAGGFLALVVLVGLHVLARGRPWTHEWLWAIYQFNFSVVLLGPAAAGLAAWEGYRTQQAEDLFASAGRAWRAVVLSWAGVFFWVVLAYGVGLVTVLVLVKVSGTPSVPSTQELWTILPALFLLSGQTSSSFALAWRVGSPLVAPAAAIAWFVVTIGLYVLGPEAAIRVGGATTSLVGLRPRLDVQITQMFFYGSLTIASLAWTRRPIHRESRLQVLRASALIAPVLVAAAVLRLDSGVLERVSTDLECFGSEPVLCAAPGYVEQLPDVRAALRPYLDALEAIDVETPTRFDQSIVPGVSNAAPLPIEVFLRTDDHEAARSTVLQSFAPVDCNISADINLVQTFVGVDYWLEAEVSGDRPFDPSLPDVLVSGTSDRQADWVRGALADLQACAA